MILSYRPEYEPTQKQKLFIFGRPVITQLEDGGYNAAIPSLKGCHAFGETVDEALENLCELESVWLELAKERGWDIPGKEKPSVWLVFTCRQLVTGEEILSLKAVHTSKESAEAFADTVKVPIGIFHSIRIEEWPVS